MLKFTFQSYGEDTKTWKSTNHSMDGTSFRLDLDKNEGRAITFGTQEIIFQIGSLAEEPFEGFKRDLDDGIEMRKKEKENRKVGKPLEEISYDEFRLELDRMYAITNLYFNKTLKGELEKLFDQTFSPEIEEKIRDQILFNKSEWNRDKPEDLENKEKVAQHRAHMARTIDNESIEELAPKIFDIMIESGHKKMTMTREDLVGFKIGLQQDSQALSKKRRAPSPL